MSDGTNIVCGGGEVLRGYWTAVVSPVQRGDVVLLGSDGLFDNLWEEDLCDTVEAHLEVSFRMEEM